MNAEPAVRAEIDAWFEKQKETLVKDVGRLIAVRSDNGEALPGKPYGEGPAAALQEAAAILEEKGFVVQNHDNRVITADLNSAQAELGILAHVDTVGVGGGWSSDPFKLDVRDGLLYGRGVIDDKGPAVAAVYAMCAARDLKPDLAKGCRIVLGSAEEIGHDDLTHYRKTHQMPPSVFTPDADYPIVNLEKGRFMPTFGATWAETTALPRLVTAAGGSTANVVPNHAEAYVEGLPLAYVQARCFEYAAKKNIPISAAAFHDGVRITAVGRAAHAAYAADGVNAQTALLAVLAELPLQEGPVSECVKALAKLFPHGDTSGTALGVAMEDEISGALTLNFGVFCLGPTGFTANFDSRTPKCAGDDNLYGVAVKALEDAGFTVTDAKKIPCHYTPEDSAIVRTILKVYEDYTGSEGKCLALGGQTYVHDIEGGVAFGPAFPGVDNRLHGADEFISVSDLILSAKMYTQIILDMCS
jgi:succinyl-diaminopimelate desuccinylase